MQPRLVESGELGDPRVPSHVRDPIPGRRSLPSRGGRHHDDGRTPVAPRAPGRRRGRRRPGRRGAGRRARAGRPPVVAASAVSAASRERVEALLPGVPVLAGARRRRALPSWCCSPSPTTRSPTWSPASRRTPAGGRGSWSCTPAAGTASACSSPLLPPGAIPLALHPAMTFTGTAVDLAPAGRLLLRRHRARAAAARGRGARRGDGRRAGGGRRGRPAAATTRPSPTARTTWSPWWRRRADLLRAAGSRSPSGCWRRCCSPRSTARCARGDAAAHRPGGPRRRRYRVAPTCGESGARGAGR